jgi:hypothetical protein
MYRLVAELFEAEDLARIAVIRSRLEEVLKTLGGAR